MGSNCQEGPRLRWVKVRPICPCLNPGGGHLGLGWGVIDHVGLDILMSGFSQWDKLTFAGTGARKKAFKET